MQKTEFRDEEIKTQKWLEIQFKIIMNKYKYIIIKHYIQVIDFLQISNPRAEIWKLELPNTH